MSSKKVVTLIAAGAAAVPSRLVDALAIFGMGVIVGVASTLGRAWWLC